MNCEVVTNLYNDPYHNTTKKLHYYLLNRSTDINKNW